MRPWWEELSAQPELIERLEEIRRDAGVEASLLRVADILVWMRQHGAGTEVLDLRDLVGSPVTAG